MIAAIYALALTLVLAAPYVAAAECAWVVWQEQTTYTDYARDRVKRVGWVLGTAFPTARECHSRIRDPFDTLIEGFPAQVRETCFPDTIDPRGPKGGGR